MNKASSKRPTRQPRYEVEQRAQFSKAQYDGLMRWLNKSAKDLGQDNRINYIWVFPNKFLKVVHATSQGKAKLAFKRGNLSTSRSFKEIEIEFDPKQFSDMVEIFKQLELPVKVYKPTQVRHNYLYKGVEIAMKRSKNWGYHAELEVMVDRVGLRAGAEKKIKAVADELGIKLMTNQEIAELRRKIGGKKGH